MNKNSKILITSLGLLIILGIVGGFLIGIYPEYTSDIDPIQTLDYWEGYFDHLKNRGYDPGNCDVSLYELGWNDANYELAKGEIRDFILNNSSSEAIKNNGYQYATIIVTEDQYSKLKIGDSYSQNCE